MNLSKKNTSNTRENERGGLNVSQHEDTQKASKIDIIDLENDYLRLNNKSKTLFLLRFFQKHFKK